MSLSRRHLVQRSAASLLLASLGQQSWAQGLDTTKIIIGFAPGGTIDLAGRRVADKLHPGYAKTAIVENKTGAGGQIAAQALTARERHRVAVLF